MWVILEMFVWLLIDMVIFGYGVLFVVVDVVFEWVFWCFDMFIVDIDKLVWYVIKVIVLFVMLECWCIFVVDFCVFVFGLFFVVDVNICYFGFVENMLVVCVECDLLLVNVLCCEVDEFVVG